MRIRISETTEIEKEEGFGRERSGVERDKEENELYLGEHTGFYSPIRNALTAL